MKLLPATTKHRPWPLPEGFKYCEKGYSIYYIDNGRFIKLKSKVKNLLVRSPYGVHYFVTRDQLIRLRISNRGIITVDSKEPTINLYKPI